MLQTFLTSRAKGVSGSHGVDGEEADLEGRSGGGVRWRELPFVWG